MDSGGGGGVHGSNRSFHDLIRSFHDPNRSFHGLSTVSLEFSFSSKKILNDSAFFLAIKQLVKVVSNNTASATTNKLDGTLCDL